jgi:hypothetical protein
MKFWDFANNNPVTLGTIVLFVCWTLVSIVQAICGR